MSAEVIEMTPPTLQRVGVVTERHQFFDSTAILVGVEDVLVADRYRKDLGDVSDLKKSIVEVGLLNPITVRAWHGSYRLVAGERRLTAFKELGLAEIPARVAQDIADARDALVAERDENTARKEMLPSEKAALGMAIEEMEKPAARERQRVAGRDFGRGIASVPGNGSYAGQETRTIAAEAVDLGSATYTRLKSLVTLAADDTQNEKVRAAAQAGLDAVDSGASVRGEYERVSAVRHSQQAMDREEPVASNEAERRADMQEWHERLAQRYPTPRLAFEAEGHERHSTLEAFSAAARATYKVTYRHTEKSYAKHVAQSQTWLENVAMSIEVSRDVFSNIDFSTITPELAADALQRIDISQLTSFIKKLKGITNE